MKSVNVQAANMWQASVHRAPQDSPIYRPQTTMKEKMDMPTMPRRTKTIKLMSQAVWRPQRAPNPVIHNTVPFPHTTPSSELCTPIANPISITREVLSAAQEEPAHFEPGHLIDNRYEILSEVARGGFGVVYRARQIGINRIVAIKRLHATHNKEAAARFLREAKIIKSLAHPNTVQLLDAVHEDGHLLLVMEYIDGVPLSTLIKQPMDLMRAVHITCQILKSISEAHQLNIIHRDLKPSNIMIKSVAGDKDFVKVLDFGIAKITSAPGRSLTADGKIMGTPQYLAPEILNGFQAATQADVFAIGLMLTEMLTGTPVFANGLKDVIALSQNDVPIVLPPHILASPIGPVLAKALDKTPSKRFANASDMLAALQPVAVALAYFKQKNTDNVPTKSPPASGRLPMLMALAASALFFILAHAFFYYFILGDI